MTNTPGPQGLTTGNSDFNAMAFVIKMLINRIGGATLVQVVSVSSPGGIAPTGMVTVQPMVDQVDTLDNTTQHGPLHNLPYFRLQGGTNAVIIDPKAGDIGLAVFASRDITKVKASKKRSPPGSRRKHSMADGLYIGGFLNGTPTTYVLMNDAGEVVVKSPTKVTVDAPNSIFTGTVHAVGDIISDSEVKARGGLVTLSGHRHTDAQGGTVGPAVG